MAGLRLAGLIVAAGLTAALPALAADPVQVPLTWLSLTVKTQVASTVLSPPPTEEGLQGARVALGENATTGKFTGQTWTLDERTAPDEAGVLAAFHAATQAGRRLFVVDVPPPVLLQLADQPDAKDALLLDATSSDDALRGADCRRNVLHLLPSRAMLADALMQYLTIKNWHSILLVTGPQPDDQKLGEAFRRSAKKRRKC